MKHMVRRNAITYAARSCGLMMAAKWIMLISPFVLTVIVVGIAKASLVENFVADVTWTIKSEEGASLSDLAEKLKDQIDKDFTDRIRELREQILERKMTNGTSMVSAISVEQRVTEANELIGKVGATIDILEEKNLHLSNYYEEILDNLNNENKELRRNNEQRMHAENAFVYASYTLWAVISIGIVSLLVRLPMLALERKQKLLEIALLENTLQKQTESAAQAPERE